MGCSNGGIQTAEKKENISNSCKRKNTKNYIQYLSDRNKLLKQEKEEEMKSIQKEIDKTDKRKKLTNINNIKTKNNYFSKNISMRKMTKLQEEYDKK